MRSSLRLQITKNATGADQCRIVASILPTVVSVKSKNNATVERSTSHSISSVTIMTHGLPKKSTTAYIVQTFVLTQRAESTGET